MSLIIINIYKSKIYFSLNASHLSFFGKCFTINIWTFSKGEAQHFSFNFYLFFPLVILIRTGEDLCAVIILNWKSRKDDWSFLQFMFIITYSPVTPNWREEDCEWVAQVWLENLNQIDPQCRFGHLMSRRSLSLSSLGRCCSLGLAHEIESNSANPLSFTCGSHSNTSPASSINQRRSFNYTFALRQKQNEFGW